MTEQSIRQDMELARLALFFWKLTMTGAIQF